MFPISDVIPSRTTPVVTFGLVALNALAFLYEIRLDDNQLELLVREYGVVPVRFAWSDVFTSMFLHGGWLHFLGNMLYLWIFGDNVEDAMGHGKYLLFYLGCGASAAVGQTFVSPDSAIPMVGASGAIAGVMGAYLVLYPRSRVLAGIFIIFFFDIIEVPAVFFLGFWFIMQLFSGVGSVVESAQGGVAFMAHVVGFLCGVAGGFIASVSDRSREEYWRQI